jgi:ribonuclease HII
MADYSLSYSLGPMTYGAAYWHPDVEDQVPKGFLDSKQLSPEKRSALFSKIKSNSHTGFVLRVLHASEISRNMLREEPYNLNAMSHDAAIQMIHAVLDAKVKIDTCYIDTVGTPGDEFHILIAFMQDTRLY